MILTIDTSAKTAVYKQLVRQIETGVRSGKLKEGEQLPSMNELAGDLGISRETVKKVYEILKGRDIIEAQQGKGFYVKPRTEGGKIAILAIFDSMSTNMQSMLSSFTRQMGGKAEITILIHNRSVGLLEYFLDENLGCFDYYMVAPHFLQDEEILKAAARQVSRIPVNKLIMLDHLLPGVNGKFGAAFQDFEKDINTALSEALPKLKKSKGLNIVIVKNALYAGIISRSAQKFCLRNNIEFRILDEISEKTVKENETYLMLNGHLDYDLVRFATIAQEKGLEFGKNIFLISYNEAVLSPLVLGGLTTVASDFTQMGKATADMILNRHLSKIHCDFHLRSRKTF